MKHFYSIFLTALLASTSLYASAQCNANFSHSVNVSDSSEYTFYDSSGGASSIGGMWYFGDGTSSWNYHNITHNYKKSGTYTVCHYIEDSIKACSDSICYSITVKFTPTCKATFSEAINLDSATFTSTGASATSYKWSFGDSSSGTGKTVSHVYNFPKNKVMTYNVCLITFDTTTNCGDSICKTFTFYVPDSCKAAFTYSDSLKTASFTNTSSRLGAGVSWLWSFGDSTTSTARHPSHTYSTYGTRVVCLTMFDSTSGCRSTFCDSVDVDTNVTTKCAANFVVTAKDLYISLTNKSVGGTSYYWQFGDGYVSTFPNPIYEYSKQGKYTICLYIKSATCQDTLCKTISVDSSKCYPYFRMGLDTSSKFKMRLYNSSSNLGSHQYSWSFGDSTYSTQRNPTHQYGAYGSYVVCLTVSDTLYGCSHTYCDTIGMDSTGKMLKGGFTMEVVEEGTSSVQDLNQLGATIYPNPVKDLLNIKLDDFSKSIDVQVFSLSGVLVLDKKGIDKNYTQFDVKPLKNGLYILQISDGDAVARMRFIKSE